MALENPTAITGISQLTGDVTTGAVANGSAVATIGAVITDAKLVAGNKLIPYGTSFPGSPVANDLFYHTGHDILYFRSSSPAQWLSLQVYTISIPPYSQLPTTAISAIGNNFYRGPVPPSLNNTKVYIEFWRVGLTTLGTNSIAANWTVRLSDSVNGAIDTVTTSLQPINTTDVITGIPGTSVGVRTLATDKLWAIDVSVKTGLPTNITLINAEVAFRWIG